MHVKRILVPVDFSEQSKQAFEEAVAMARERAASLTLMHVHQITEVAMLEFVYVEPPEKVSEVVDAAERTLASWAKEQKLAPGTYEIKVVTGAPVAEILRASERHDLVVMGTHGRSGLSHFLLGSVAERVIQGARCSVLVVKGHGARHEKR
jgi:nucleotide-binding universal stress UspA family protein